MNCPSCNAPNQNPGVPCTQCGNVGFQVPQNIVFRAPPPLVYAPQGQNGGGQCLAQQPNNVVVQQQPNNTAKSGLSAGWLVAGLLGLAFVVLMFWLAFGGIKEQATANMASLQTAINSHTDAVAQGVNSHNDGIANAINANVNAARDAINNNTVSAVAGAVAQDNANTSAVRGDIAKASADGISATNAARDSLKAQAQAEAEKTRARIWSLNKKLNGLATKADIDASADKLQAWMDNNKAKVTVTPAPAPSASPQPAPAPGPAGGTPSPANPGAPLR